jgi:hypothetical protein
MFHTCYNGALACCRLGLFGLFRPATCRRSALSLHRCHARAGGARRRSGTSAGCGRRGWESLRNFSATRTRRRGRNLGCLRLPFSGPWLSAGGPPGPLAVSLHDFGGRFRLFACQPGRFSSQFEQLARLLEPGFGQASLFSRRLGLLLGLSRHGREGPHIHLCLAIPLPGIPGLHICIFIPGRRCQTHSRPQNRRAVVSKFKVVNSPSLAQASDCYIFWMRAVSPRESRNAAE